MKRLRTTDFMSHVYLKEHQRQLIFYFKKYQLTELEGDKDKLVFDAAMLGSTAQNLLDDDKEESATLRVQQLNLAETVRELTSWEGPADLAVLYEVTGF